MPGERCPGPARAIAGGIAIALTFVRAGAATIGGTPALIGVPAALLGQNSGGVEASGVVWAAPLGRYLIVGDDTGTEDRKHQPWVFAMNAKGALDPTAVPILGIAEINDPEAICSGPEGTFFLTTSHSENKKGKCKPPRRMLLHLKLEGRGLRVLGQVDLTTAEDGRGGGLLAIAGVDPGGKLDIEALSYHQNALLIGLKAPLTAEGHAVILRLAKPVQALKAGRIEPGALTRFRDVDLRVQRPEGMVGRGISDLTSLADGSFVLCANSPKNMPYDGGGGVYWLKPGAPAPVLLREYAGIKPEGIAPANDGKELVLVFDNGVKPPQWTRLPFPK